MSLPQRVLVSHELKPIATGDSELDRKLHEWQREHVAHVFERLRYHTLYSPDHERTEAERAASVTPTDYRYPPGHLYRYKVGSVLVDATNDWAAAFNAAVDQYEAGGDEVVVPGAGSGFYRCNSPIDVASALKMRGCGTAVTIRFYGCDGIDIAASSAQVELQNLELFSLSAAGATDPRTHIGIDVNGTSGNAVNYFRARKLYLRGWGTCIDWAYTWNSVVDDSTTINCDTGIRLFGQSVNNSINNSRILANAGVYCIRGVKDGATTPEGLYVTNSLVAQGDYGFHSDGFLALHVSNCVIDLIDDTALDLTNVQGLNLGTNWIYAANYGVRWRDLVSVVDQQSSIAACRIEVTAANGKSVMIGSNNTGISMTGGTYVAGPSGTARCIYIETTGCDNISAVGINLVNPTANPSIFAGVGGFRHDSNIGNDTVQYNAVEGYTGTVTGCTTSPTGAIKASIQGDTITLQIPTTTGLSNSTACTITGMPAELRPLSQHVSTCVVQDAGAEHLGRLVLGTDGVITLHKGVSPTFTNDGLAKGISEITFTYRRF